MHLQAGNRTVCTLVPVARAAVVIPNWNGARYLGECLDSLAAQSERAALIVVDGGSHDGSVALVRERFPEVALLALEANRGFAGAVNHGIRHALATGCQYVALLNNDAVADSDWLARLIATAEAHPSAGTVTSKLLRYDRVHIDSTGDFYSSWGWAYPRGAMSSTTVSTTAPTSARCSAAAAAQASTAPRCSRGRPVRRGLLRLSGGSGPRLPRAAARLDRALRAGRARLPPHDGHELGIAHFGRYQAIRNCVYLYVKNMPAPLCWRYLPKFVLGLALMAANDVRRRRLRAIAVRIWRRCATCHGCSAERRRIQSRRRVSVAYIDSILVHPLPPTQRNLVEAA